jgi:hypothetical protein
MIEQKPSLFGLKHSNRDFTQKEAWGKNQFNSSFPAALCSYIHSKGLKNIYLKLDSELEVTHLACSIVQFFKQNIKELKICIEENFKLISDWTEPQNIIPHIANMIDIIDRISLRLLPLQQPFLMQPIWKTEGKSSKLADNCLDVFIWSNLAFTRLFLNLTNKEENIKNISRPIRTVIWLFKMIYDFSVYEQIDFKKIIDELSYNTKNDKAFAVNGKVTHSYLKSLELEKPRIKKSEIREIILGGGHNLLSPERRFDAIIYNSPDLFD